MHAPRTPIAPRIDRCLWQWLTLGILACLLLPSARDYHPTFGWLWYWLLAAPAIALLALRAQRVLAARGSAPRRRRSHPCFARPRIARGAIRPQSGISARVPVRIASRIALDGRSS